MTVLTAYGYVQPEKEELVIEASRKNKSIAVTESGCERFDYFFSPEDPCKFVFVEEWTTRQDLENHFAMPHFAEFMGVMQECLTGAPEIRIFEATLEVGA